MKILKLMSLAIISILCFTGCTNPLSQNKEELLNQFAKEVKKQKETFSDKVAEVIEKNILSQDEEINEEESSNEDFNKDIKEATDNEENTNAEINNAEEKLKNEAKVEQVDETENEATESSATEPIIREVIREVYIETPVEEPVYTPPAPTTMKDYYLSKLNSIDREILSITRNTVNTEEYIYNQYDNLINEIWTTLKNDLPSSQFANLKQQQLQWIKSKENRAAQEGMYSILYYKVLSEETRSRIVFLINNYCN